MSPSADTQTTTAERLRALSAQADRDLDTWLTFLFRTIVAGAMWGAFWAIRDPVVSSFPHHEIICWIAVPFALAATWGWLLILPRQFAAFARLYRGGVLS